MLKVFRNTFVLSIAGLVLAAFLGYYDESSLSGALQFLFIALILALLETSISFDNAIVNASVLKEMTPLWQKRFLTWGIFVAVFGMRLIFPVVIVCVAATISPQDAITLAFYHPSKYSEIMQIAHPQVSAFGGAFLALVALRYFFNAEKEVFWIGFIEKYLNKLGLVKSAEIGFCLLGVWIYSRALPDPLNTTVLFASVAGVICFVFVQLLGEILSMPQKDGITNLHRKSLGLFLYLEVLDASFSFDGVIAAFAITYNPLLIALGLGIGALFVRSFTVYMVKHRSLDAYIFLENGAFWAIGLLAVIMFVSIRTDVPEIVSGGIGLIIIAASFFHSLIHNKYSSNPTS
ncbi:MAG: DUF475 domain-containing protein [Bdellovibrionaceae bacterium]|nr:DUF475 domain-containing protein [Pseudobdellovibrionaceae bacterium]